MKFQYSSRESGWETLSDLTRYINEHHTEHAKSLLEVTLYMKALEENPAQNEGPFSAIDQLAEIQKMLTEALETVNLFGEREKEFEESRRKMILKVREAQQEIMDAKAETNRMISRADSLQTEIRTVNAKAKLIEDAKEDTANLLRGARQQRTLAEAKFEQSQTEAATWKRRASAVRRQMKELEDCRAATELLVEQKDKLEEDLKIAASSKEEANAEAEKWKTRATNMRAKYLKAIETNGTTSKEKDSSARKSITSKDASPMPS